jgi:DNA-binding GntR family transcriptional regulator
MKKSSQVAGLRDKITSPVSVSWRMKTSLAEHKEIIKSFRKNDPEECERKMRQHIRNVRDGVKENIKIFLSDGGKQPSKSKEER